MENWTLTAVSGFSALATATTSPADSLKGFKHSGFMRKRRVALYSPSSGVCSATVNILDDMDAIVSRGSVIVGAEDGRNFNRAPKICDAADLLHPQPCTTDLAMTS
jgi:hypothetical protein